MGHRDPGAPEAPEPPGAFGAPGRRPGQPPAHPLLAGSRKFGKKKTMDFVKSIVLARAFLLVSLKHL